MIKIENWRRENNLESDTCPRVWSNSNTDEEVRVEKFHEDDTWDATYEGRILENYDSAEEAIERGKSFISD